jgi:hypothetical protein
MFMMLMDGVAWVAVIGVAVVAFMLVTAGLGALIGNAIALLKRKRRPL